MKLKFPKIEFNSPVVIYYTIAAFVVLLFGYATNHQTTDSFFTCFRTNASDPMMYIRMVSYVFGHSSASHYTGNFFLIILIGPMLEEKYGSKTLLVMMATTALAGGIVNVAIGTHGLRGASGIVFLFIILCSCTKVEAGKIPLSMVLVVLIYIGKELVIGVTSSDNISQITHIIGGICGIVFGLYYNKKQVEKKKKEEEEKKKAEEKK
ncbi:MAG: rhomboid family intramembrane serine protease [Oscillospiraceae bacterium]|jgi:membrane associated rhomboid family serine protease|nr:rhomboid family intramembrane serine protease [Oscillospiraceae bacterium]MBQ8010104.1 rhomboid family intramembrane serine protease [Oscillospiraceae bacterium]MBQ9109961.1 rhomboid family intramembrane serine protease [Oscillospiraceae bacterium]